jgi:hypothetical protein
MRHFIALLGIVSLLQQSAVQPSGNSVDTPAQKPIQKIVANVVDSNGHFIDGLRAGDFIVQENGVQKVISQFIPDSNSPISMGVLIDTSLSMGFAGMRGRGASQTTSPRWAAAMGATRALLHLTRAQDEFQLMSFAATMEVIQSFTPDHSKIESHLREMGPNTYGTNISGAIDSALKEMKKSANRRRGLVVITDVEDNEGGGVAALRRSIHTEEVPVYIFALRPEGQVGRGTESVPVGDTLKTVDKSGDGQSLVIDVDRLQSDEAAIKIVNFVTEFTKELRGQYSIFYPSSVPDEAAAERAIRIRAVPPGLTVHFRRE